MSESKSMHDLREEYKEQLEYWENKLLCVKKEIRGNSANKQMLLTNYKIIEDTILDLKFSIALMTNYLE